MQQPWFDTLEGKFIVGEAAYSQSVEQSSPGQILPLKELLDTDSFPHGLNDFEKSPLSEWSRERLIELAAWTFQVINQGEPKPRRLQLQHMQRLFILGQGPDMRKNRLVGSMGELRTEIGDERGRDNHYYDSLSSRDIMRMALKLSTKLGRKPTKYDYDADAILNRKFIMRRFGSVGKLNELIGFLNVHAMTPEDFVDWGARLARAEGPQAITRERIKELSRLKRGPSQTTIYKYFGSWGNFESQVLDQYALELTVLENHRTQKLAEYHTLLSIHELPDMLAQRNEDELLQFGARYTLAKHLLRHRPDAHAAAQQIATSQDVPFVSCVRRIDATLTAAYIETEALIMDVYDEIWPPINTFGKVAA